MSEDSKEEEKKQNELGEESNNAIDVNESSGEINYFAKMMDKDSELLS